MSPNLTQSTVPTPLLGLIKPPTQAAAVTLFNEPLYAYANENKEIHVLIVGTGAYADAMLRMMLSACQMLGHALHFHLVAKDAKAYLNQLKRCAPALNRFVVLGKHECDRETPPLAYLSAEDLPGINMPAANKHIAAYLDTCRYAVVDLPKNSALQAQFLLSQMEKQPRPGFIAYADQPFAPAARPSHTRLSCLIRQDGRFADTLNRLGETAFRVHYHYHRLYADPCADFKTLRETFAASRYEQEANLSPAVHTKYKLHSIGVNPNAHTQTIMTRCAKLLFGKDTTRFDALSYLEHNRWLMEKVLAGYRAPASTEELLAYCFVHGNNKWRSDERRFHNCIILRELHPAKDLRTLSHQEWDALYTGPSALEAIENSGYDPLDKMALTVHQLGKVRMEELQGLLAEEKERLNDTIAQMNRLGYATPSAYNDYLNWLDQIFQGAGLHRQQEMAGQLLAAGKNLCLPPAAFDGLLQLVERSIPVLKNFYAYKIYKVMDDFMVDQLPTMYCCTDPLTLIKPASPQLMDNIASALLLEPARTVYLGMEPKTAGCISEFFHHRGDFTSLAFLPDDPVENFRKVLAMETSLGRCVVDVTGAAPQLVMIAAGFAANHPGISIITCDSRTQQIENLLRFPEAACIRRRAALTVSDVFALMGSSRRKRIDENDALLLKGSMSKLWGFFKKNDGHLLQLSGVVAAAVAATDQSTASCPAFYPLSRLEEDQNHFAAIKETDVYEGLFEDTRKEALLRDLQDHGLIRGLRITRHPRSHTVDVSYEVIHAFYSYAGALLSLKGDIYNPLHAAVTDGQLQLQWSNPEDRRLYVNALFQLAPDGKNASITYKNAGGDLSTQKFPLELIRNGLGSLESYGLICNLNLYDYTDHQGRRLLKVTFFFAMEAVKHLLMTSGSFLEAKTWAEAVELQYFDDVVSNYKFLWSPQEDTENELDVLMTKGLQLYVCSCKDTKVKKEHLYEVLCIAGRFSVHAVPVIVHTEPVAPSITSRARSMGVEMIHALAQGPNPIRDALAEMTARQN